MSLYVPVLVEHPLTARIAVYGRAVLGLVLVCALRRGRKFVDDLEPLDSLSSGGRCSLMCSSFVHLESGDFSGSSDG